MYLHVTIAATFECCCYYLQDNQQLIEDLKTGFAIPGDVDFEEYTGRSGRSRQKARKRVS